MIIQSQRKIKVSANLVLDFSPNHLTAMTCKVNAFVNQITFWRSKIAKVVGIYIDYDHTQRSEDRDAISRSDRSIGKVDLHIKSKVWN